MGESGQGRRWACWGGLLGLLLVSAGVPAAAVDPAAQAQEVIRDPDLTYTASFTWACPAATWEQVLDEPLLMGHLWEAYQYAPAYRFSTRGESLHVDDPTGMQGDALLVSRGPGSRTWLVHGRLDHWAVPFFNQGTAVFVLTSRPVGDQIAAELQVYVTAGSTMGSMVLALGRPLLARHVQNRLTLNLQDGRRLVETVAARPTEAAALLTGQDAARFWARFGG